MEEIRTVAMALFNNGSSESQAAVKTFFNSMDTDRSGSISKKEFTCFLDKKFPELFNPEFFSLLDEDGNGSLDFKEVLAFFYFTNYRGVFCQGTGCRTALFGLYFTCSCCFVDQSCQKSYDLCLSCFQRKNHAHEHTQFLDNYAMLNVVKKDAGEKDASEEDVRAREEDVGEEVEGEKDADTLLSEATTTIGSSKRSIIGRGSKRSIIGRGSKSIIVGGSKKSISMMKGFGTKVNNEVGDVIDDNCTIM